jgi:hypothetical protein
MRFSNVYVVVNLVFLQCVDFFVLIMMRSQVPSYAQEGPWFLKQRNCGDLRARSQLSALKGVKRRAEAPGWN